jgi:PAS domain S-box-containing protein
VRSVPEPWPETDLSQPPLAAGASGPPDSRAPLVLRSAMGDESPARRFLDAAPDALVGVTAGGRITVVNAQTERVFGYQRRELEGQPVGLLVPEGIRAVDQFRAGYRADSVPRPMGAALQLTGRRRDGSTFPAEITCSWPGAAGAAAPFPRSSPCRPSTRRRESSSWWPCAR